MKTNAALAAALIRKEIKAAFPSLQFRCKSQNYSGGNSVNVYMVDQPKAVVEKIKALTDKYEYGHFDGMTDCYEFSNSRDDIPQVKFLFVNNELSSEKRQEIYAGIRQKWSGGDSLPENYEAGRDINFQGHYISEMVWREFAASM